MEIFDDKCVQFALFLFLNAIGLLAAIFNYCYRDKVDRWERLTNAIVQFLGFPIFGVFLLSIIMSFNSSDDNIIVSPIMSIVYIILSLFLISGRGIETLQLFIQSTREADSYTIGFFKLFSIEIKKTSKSKPANNSN